MVNVVTSETFFLRGEPPAASYGSDDWFEPTTRARGPWDPDSAHAGPPTALLARAVERLVPHQSLVRLTVELTRPVPMAPIGVRTDALRIGRNVSSTRAEIIDGEGRIRAAAWALHIAPANGPMWDHPLVSGRPSPRLADSEAGEFPFPRLLGADGGFSSGVRMRYSRGGPDQPGPTTAWMCTIPLLPGEEMSPFQKVCPLADCTNAFSRHADPNDVQFMNADLTVSVHRSPVGDWIGASTRSAWQPSGIGVAEATLFDQQGPVGSANQTLLLRPAR